MRYTLKREKQNHVNHCNYRKEQIKIVVSDWFSKLCSKECFNCSSIFRKMVILNLRKKQNKKLHSGEGVRLGKYELGRTLGEGNFGKVKFARNTDSGQPYAIKIVDKNKIIDLNITNQVCFKCIFLSLIQSSLFFHIYYGKVLNLFCLFPQQHFNHLCLRLLLTRIHWVYVIFVWLKCKWLVHISYKWARYSLRNIYFYRSSVQ